MRPAHRITRCRRPVDKGSVDNAGRCGQLTVEKGQPRESVGAGVYGAGPEISSAADELSAEVAGELVDGDAILGHGVALADGYGVVGEGVEVDGHAERRADLVLAAVTAPDGAGVVEVNAPMLATGSRDVAGLGRE